VAVRDGYADLDPSSGRLELVAAVAPDDPGIRMNDGKVGPDGGFWAGSMVADESPGRVVSTDSIRMGRSRRLA
jgi:sugar lactone lactonase YvrE